MTSFWVRHRTPLMIWAALALASAIFCTLSWFIFTPHEPIFHWTLLTVVLMASWGAPTLVAIGGRELLDFMEQRHKKALAELMERD